MKKIFFCMLVFVACFACYLYTCCPSISTGDSGEFCASAVTLSITHAPGYPLYSLLGKIFTLIVPFGNYAYRINIFSAVFASFAAIIVFLLVLKLLPPGGRSYIGIITVLISVFFLFLSKSFWSSAVQAEVFCLNVFFAALITYLLEEISVKGNIDADFSAARLFCLASFLLGLGLGNHQTIIFMSFSMIYLYFSLYTKNTAFLRRILFFLVFFVLGALVYIYLPARALKEPPLDVGDPKNLHNLYRVITRADYGSLSLTAGEKTAYSLRIIIKQAVRFVQQMNSEFTFAGILLGIAGIFYLAKHNKKFLNVLIISFIVSGPFFILLGNPSFTAEADGILGRFYMMPGLFWVILAGSGSCLVLEKLGNLAGRLMFMFILLFFLCFNLVQKNIMFVNFREYFLTYDYGRNILKTLPPGSVFFMDGGDDTFYSAAYLCFAEMKRGDVELYDRGGVVFRSAYGQDFRQLSKEDKNERRAVIEKSFAGKRAVVYSTFNKNILPGINLYPGGILYSNANSGQDAWNMYSLERGIFREYYDYRSRALVPVYTFFRASSLADYAESYAYFRYSYYCWPGITWLRNNLLVELHGRAFNLFQEKKLQQSRMYYGLILDINPSDEMAITNLGALEEELGNTGLAINLYQRAMAVNPGYAEAYFNLGVIYWKKGDWKKVVELFTKVLELNPGHAGARQYLPRARAMLK